MNIQPYPQSGGYSQIVKLGISRQLVIPKRILHSMKLKTGGYFEILQRDKEIVLKPKVVVDKELEAGLAQSFADFKAGRSYGPFETAEDMIESLHGNVRRIRAERRKSKLHNKR